MSVSEISVSYTLDEHLSFVRDHLPTMLRGKAHPPPWLISATVSLAFAIKKLQMPVCDFSIDDQRIRRRTARGELNVPWSEVIAVHRYSQGFLVERTRGSMGLPYRSFNAEQVAQFESMLARARLS